MTIDDDSKQIFLKAMADVKPLDAHHKNKIQIKPIKKTTKQPIKHKHSFSEPVLNKNEFIDVMPLAAELILSLQKQSSNKRFNELKKGLIAIEARLDLHKYSCAQASSHVIDFIRECSKRSLSCALIIHGKGQGLVKGVTESILSRSADVLAFHSATAQDGGTGAVYVLFKG